MALKRMGAFCKTVVLGFRFGRLELALIRPERKHNSKALPPYSSRGFFPVYIQNRHCVLLVATQILYDVRFHG